jgi:methionyl-tRNA synthetase
MIVRYNGGLVEDLLSDDEKTGELKTVAESSIRDYSAAMEEYKIDEAVQSTWKLIRRANQFIEETAPWQLAKEQSKREQLLSALNALLESIRIISVLLLPVMPGKSAQMWEGICLSGSPDAQRLGSLGWSGSVAEAGRKVAQVEPLFPRIST